jgi:hypothetical protein
MSYFNDDVKLVQANDTIMEVYHKILAYCEPTENVKQAMSKLLEATFWIRHQYMEPRPINEDKQPTLSDDNSDSPAPKKKTRKIELPTFQPKAEPIVITEPKAEPIVITQEPAKVSISIEDVRMNFKNFCQSNSIEKGKDILASFNVTNISELYKLGDEKVIMFCNLIV